MISAELSPRARFWRRVFELIIDCCAVGAVISAIGILLFSPTDGWIRARGTPVSYSICAAGTAPAGLDLPADFNVTHVARCTSYFFGVAHDRTLNFSEVTRSGPVTYTRWLAFPTDAEGRPSKAFYLDDLVILILACYLILSEWKFGTTLGKRILGMHVRLWAVGR